MEITRNQLIAALSDHFFGHPSVYALWLEGADATDTVDAYSDIDFWFDVEDEYIEGAFTEIEMLLTAIHPLDYAQEASVPHPKLRHKIYHLQDTSIFLKLDVVIQAHSRDPKESTFIIDDPIESPKVLFDKANVICFVESNQFDLLALLDDRILQLERTFNQAGVRKYAARGEFLEAFSMYQRYVLTPLIELLRIHHTPLHPDYGLVHISRHLPADLLITIEEFHKISSTEDLLEKSQTAEKMFRDFMNRLRASRYENSTSC